MMSHVCQASVTPCAKIPFQSTGYQVLKISQRNSLEKLKYNASANDKPEQPLLITRARITPIIWNLVRNFHLIKKPFKPFGHESFVAGLRVVTADQGVEFHHTTCLLNLRSHPLDGVQSALMGAYSNV